MLNLIQALADFGETLLGAGFVFVVLPAALAFLLAQAAFIAALIALLTVALCVLAFGGVDSFAVAALCLLATQIFFIFSL